MMANIILSWSRVVPFALQAVQSGSGSVPPDQLGQQIALEAVKHNPANSPVSFIVPIGFFAMIFGIVWLRWRQQQARLQTKAELNKQLLDKFASGRDFAEFLERKGSQRFLEDFWSQGAQSKEKTLRYGIVIAMLGLGFFSLAWMKREFVIPGVLLLAVGAGFLISFAVSHRLAKARGEASESGPANIEISQN